MKKEIQKILLLFPITLLLLVAVNSAKAQANPNDLVYKFSVNNITNATPAKQVQLILLQQPNITSCKFIDEADCFKLVTYDFISYEMIKNILLANGYELTGDIKIADGRILKEKLSPQTQVK